MTTTIEERFAIGFATDGTIAVHVAQELGLDATLRILQLVMQQYPERLIIVRSFRQEGA